MFEFYRRYEEVEKAVLNRDFVHAKNGVIELQQNTTDISAAYLVKEITLQCLQTALTPKNAQTFYPEGTYFLQINPRDENVEAQYFLEQAYRGIKYDERSFNFRPSYAVQIMQLQLEHPEVYKIEHIIPTLAAKITLFENEMQQRLYDKNTKTYDNALLQIGNLLGLFSAAFLGDNKQYAQLEQLIEKFHNITGINPGDFSQPPASDASISKINALSVNIFAHVYEKMRKQRMRRKKTFNYDAFVSAILATNTLSLKFLTLMYFELNDSEFASTYRLMKIAHDNTSRR